MGQQRGPKTLQVKAGDHIPKIAAAEKFIDWKTIWDHANNQSLKDNKRTPAILNPNDAVYIPEKATDPKPGATTKDNPGVIPSNKIKLRIKLKDLSGKERSGLDCTVVTKKEPSKTHAKTSDGSGLVETEPIAVDSEDASLTVVPTSEKLEIRIGHMNPIATRSGQMARLNNLGYNAGKLVNDTDVLDAAATKQLQSAIEEFQCDNELTVDGILGPNTQAKLKEVHGC